MQITDEMVNRALEAHDKITGARQGPYAEYDRRPVEIAAMRAALEAALSTFDLGQSPSGQ
jgi:hypothetical protein